MKSNLPGTTAAPPSELRSRPGAGSRGRNLLHRYGVPLLMVAPFLFVFAAFVVVPVVRSLAISFTDYNAVRAGNFVGMRNYIELFQDERFYKALSNTSLYVVFAVVISTALGLGLAMVFGGQRASDQVFRALFFLPSVAGGIAVLALWRWILSSEDYGLLNTILRAFGGQSVSWLGTPRLVIPVLVALAVWGGMGYNMILFLAGLRSIPGELYEAAAIDGANAGQRFWKITLPLLRPTLLFVVITGTIGAFQIFNEPYLLFGTVSNPGGILDSALTLVSYLFDRGFRRLELGAASSIAWVLFLIIFALTLANLRLGRASQND